MSSSSRGGLIVYKSTLRLLPLPVSPKSLSLSRVAHKGPGTWSQTDFKGVLLMPRVLTRNLLQTFAHLIGVPTMTLRREMFRLGHAFQIIRQFDRLAICKQKQIFRDSFLSSLESDCGGYYEKHGQVVRLGEEIEASELCHKINNSA